MDLVIANSQISSVLLNGVPGKPFECRRGVRQGDPLSPLLFVLVANLLQSVLNDALHQCLIHYPVLINYSNGFPMNQYADDTLIVISASIDQLHHLRKILDEFVVSTSLKVNFHK